YRGVRIYTPLLQVHGCRPYQPHVAVNARAGVPARIGIVAMVYPYGQYIFLAIPNIRREVIHKRNIAVGTFAKRLPVDEHFTVVVYTLEVNVQLLAAVFRGHVNRFTVPADAPRQVTRGARQRGTERLLYRPIVRQVQPFP